MVATALQFGHDLSVVETCGAVGYTSDKCALQFGHDLSVVETLILLDAMETKVGRLQFGHDLSVVETAVWPKGLGTRRYKLQFGHDLSVVETRYGQCPLPWPIPRFNSATTFQSWKRDGIPHPHLAITASIRPQPFSRGNHPSRTAWYRFHLASIRPRPFSRGNCFSSGR